MSVKPPRILSASSRAEAIFNDFQREVCGIHGLGQPLEDFSVPGEVRVRIGVSPSPAA